MALTVVRARAPYTKNIIIPCILSFFLSLFHECISHACSLRSRRVVQWRQQQSVIEPWCVSFYAAYIWHYDGNTHIINHHRTVPLLSICTCLEARRTRRECSIHDFIIVMGELKPIGRVVYIQRRSKRRRKKRERDGWITDSSGSPFFFAHDDHFSLSHSCTLLIDSK